MNKNDELLYTQEDMDEWMRTCDNLQEHIKEKDKEIKELRNRVAELEDKDWYELCIRQLEEQNYKLIKQRDELLFEKRNVFGLIEKMEVKVAGVTKEKILAIRRQVCNELRNWLNENFIRIGRVKNNEPIVITFDNEELMKFLDQIEQGEQE